MESDTSWSAHQLTEFLAAVSAVADAPAALRAAVERAAEALEAEVGALVDDARVLASVGYARDRLPVQDVRAAAANRDSYLDVPGVGRCAVLAVTFEDIPEGKLLVARSGDDPYTPDERNLLRGLARVLSLSLRGLRVLTEERRLRQESEQQSAQNARLLSSLQERQALLEGLSVIQHSISSRAPIDEVLAAIASGVAKLMGDQIVALRRLDPDRPGCLALIASVGIPPDLAASCRHIRMGEGVGGRAAAEDRLVVIDDYAAAEGCPRLPHVGVVTAMAAPVHENGRVVGSLAVASRVADRRYRPADRDILVAFAEHVSLAMTDAAMVQALQGALGNARHDAMHDRLTSLPNRALLNDRLTAAFHRAVRQHAGVAVLFLDLDGFKRVNDSLGHAVGDQLLVAVAERLTECVRTVDTVARLGGDEFALLLEDIQDPREADRVGDKVLTALRAPFTLAGQQITISASIGVAVHNHVEEADNLLRYADLAMYEAKAAGKGRHRRFEQAMHSRSLARLGTEIALRRALDEGQLVVHYQPIVDLKGGALVATEALVRWQHPNLGLVPPAEFISVAESTGLIVPLGGWVLFEACRQTQLWADSHPDRPPLSVSVNLSAGQFQPGLVELVASAVEDSCIAPRRLVLEITESTLMQDTQVTLDLVHQLKQIGVRLAIDDFGTGHSSLSYLRRFPLDTIKIDKSFIDGVARDTNHSALAHAIIKLARTLELCSVAEGIEHAGQAVKLRSLQCDLGQGNYFAKPMPPEELAELLDLSTLQPQSRLA
jgi:diguanylate cyclase (GGDEF)-like protein